MKATPMMPLVTLRTVAPTSSSNPGPLLSKRRLDSDCAETGRIRRVCQQYSGNQDRENPLKYGNSDLVQLACTEMFLIFASLPGASTSAVSTAAGPERT